MNLRDAVVKKLNAGGKVTFRKLDSPQPKKSNKAAGKTKKK